MTRIAQTLAIALATTPAVAHPGHYGEAAGHTHWIALAALIGAGALAAGLVIRWYLRRRARAVGRAASRATEASSE